MPCLIPFLNELSSRSLHGYLKLASIYDGNANKKKSDLVEMIIYGYINGKLKDKVIDDISTSRAQKILKDKNINVKGLPGHGNMGLKQKDIKTLRES